MRLERVVVDLGSRRGGSETLYLVDGLQYLGRQG